MKQGILKWFGILAIVLSLFSFAGIVSAHTGDDNYSHHGMMEGMYGGFGMWAPSGILFPVFHMKKQFVTYNTKGSSIFNTTSSNDFDTR